MARPLRIQYEGAVYHIISWGNDKQSIFIEDADRKAFLRLLQESLEIYHTVLYGYVMMTNHFHLLIETPLANISEFMRRFNIAYTGYFNRKHSRSGHLYQGRFHSILIERELYLDSLSRYIHLNPIRIKKTSKWSMEEKTDFLKTYKWSSLQGYIAKKHQKDFIDYTLILSDYGGNTSQGCQNYWNVIQGEIETEWQISKKIIARTVLGSKKFLKQVTKHIPNSSKKKMPALKNVEAQFLKDEILQAFYKTTGRDLDSIRTHPDSLRHLLMDLLYRYSGMKGTEIGQLLGLTYSTVSIGRKRLREKLKSDKKLKALYDQITTNLTRNKL